MKTKIRYRRGQIALMLDDGSKDPWHESPRVAQMELYEGTGCWQLVDIRLAPYHTIKSPYSCSLSAEHYYAHYKPRDETEASALRKTLREYDEDEEGFHWCTFHGIVRGHKTVRGYRPSWLTHEFAGFFSRSESLSLLKEMQQWWEAYDGEYQAAKIPNPNIQPTQTDIWMRFAFENRFKDEKIVEKIVDESI